MKLKCHCGCDRELKRTRDLAGNPTGVSCIGTQFDKNKRFYDDECRKKWEARRVGPRLATVNGHASV